MQFGSVFTNPVTYVNMCVCVRVCVCDIGFEKSQLPCTQQQDTFLPSNNSCTH